MEIKLSPSRILNIIFFTVLFSGFVLGATRVADTFINGLTWVNTTNADIDNLYVDNINEVLYVQAGNATDIQAKIDSCSGGTIVIPVGTYDLTSSITIKNGIELRGSGKRNTLINCSLLADQPCIKYTDGARSYDVVVANMKLYGNDTSDSVGINMTNISTSIFRNMEITDFDYAITGSGSNYYNGFYDLKIYSNGYNVYLDSSSNENIFYNSFFNTATGKNIYIDSTNNINFFGCAFEGANQMIHIDSNADLIGFYGCRMEFTGTSNLTLDGDETGLFSQHLSGVTIINNGNRNLLLSPRVGYDLFLDSPTDFDGNVVRNARLNDSIISNGEDLIGYWSFDDGVGTVLHDSSREANDGVIDSSGVWEYGKFDNALDFDGSATHVNISHDSAYATIGAGSLSFWYRFDTVTNYDKLFSFFVSSSDRYYCEYYNTRIQCYDDINNANDPNSFSYAGGVTPNTWYHLAITYNTSHFQYYLDGNLISTNAGSNGWGEIDSFPIYLGSKDGSVEYLDGNLDEFKLFNRTLTDEEVQAEYLLGQSSHSSTGHLISKSIQEYDTSATRPTASEGVCYWNTTAGYKGLMCYNSTDWRCADCNACSASGGCP